MSTERASESVCHPRSIKVKHFTPFICKSTIVCNDKIHIRVFMTITVPGHFLAQKYLKYPEENCHVMAYSRNWKDFFVELLVWIKGNLPRVRNTLSGLIYKDLSKISGEKKLCEWNTFRWMEHFGLFCGFNMKSVLQIVQYCITNISFVSIIKRNTSKIMMIISIKHNGILTTCCSWHTNFIIIVWRPLAMKVPFSWHFAL